jgi:uncharacterized membrane protein YphA (DoxX/SURF4 family)
MSKGKKIALWTVSILLCALFLFAGIPKLLQPAKIGPMFVQYGYAAWFATFIGICEVLGAIGLLVQRVAALAAAGLSIIMVGAVYTLVSHHEAKQAITPLVVFVLLIMVSYTRFLEAKAYRGQPIR